MLKLKYKNPDNSYFAKSNFRGHGRLVGLKLADRALHKITLGKTGAGKTNLILCQLIQQARSKFGFCVYDIHADIIPTLLPHIPKHRQKDIVYLDLPNPQLKLGYNPLRKVSYEKRSLVASALLESFQRLFGAAWGIRMEGLLRNIILSLLDQPKANIADITRIIHDKAFREKCITHVVNPDLKKFWLQEFDKYSKNDFLPITNKVGAFLAHPAIKRVLIENKENISLRQIMDEGKILLINLSKGSLGMDTTQVMASLLLSSMASAGFSRVDTPEEKRLPFFLYLDEFGQYATYSIVNYLSEMRKFKIFLEISFQHLSQLKGDIRESVFGNVGSIVSFRTSAQDATYMLKEMYKEKMPELTIGDFVDMPKYHVWIKLMVDKSPSKPFTAVTIPYQDFL